MFQVDVPFLRKLRDRLLEVLKWADLHDEGKTELRWTNDRLGSDVGHRIPGAIRSPVVTDVVPGITDESSVVGCASKIVAYHVLIRCTDCACGRIQPDENAPRAGGEVAAGTG